MARRARREKAEIGAVWCMLWPPCARWTGGRRRFSGSCPRCSGRSSRCGAYFWETATGLFLSGGTVRNRLSSAVGKLHARTLVDAVRIAAHHGWL